MALTKISTGGVKDDAVTAGKIPANAVGSSEIADDAVDQGAIADEAVDEARLQISNAGSNGEFLQKQSGNTGGLTWAAANQYTHPNHSGEVTSSADGATTIASNIVDEDNLKISNAGSNGQFLSKQSGNTGGLTWADVPSSDPEVSIVASGTISTGQVVYLKSDGKVAVPTFIPQTTTATVAESTSNLYYTAASYDASQNKILVIYADGGNSQAGTGVVGTVSGDTISFGTPVVWHSNTVYNISISYNANQSAHLIVYDSNSSPQGFRVIWAKVNGNTFTVGGSYELWGTTSCTHIDMSSATDSDGNLIVYRNSYNRIYGNGVDLNGSGGPSLSLATSDYVSGSGSFGGTSCAYAPSPAQRHLVAYCSWGSSATGIYAKGVKVVGTADWSDVNEVTIDTCRSTGTTCDFDSTNLKFLLVYNDNTNGKVKSKVIHQEMSAGNWQWTVGAVNEFDTSAALPVDPQSLKFNPDTGKFVWHYFRSGSGGKLRYATIDASNNTVSWTAEENANSTATSEMIALYDTGSDKEIFVFNGTNNSAYAGTKVAATNTITNDNYLGVSSGNYSDGDTAVIKLAGSTVASSSLTPGTKIYSSDTGALSPTAGVTSVVVGKALSATSVLITE